MHLWIISVHILLACAGNPHKRYMTSSPSSQHNLLGATNYGAGNFLAPWLSDSDLLTLTLRRLLFAAPGLGSEEATRLVQSIRDVKGITALEELRDELLNVPMGPAQEFIAEVYRGKGQLGHSWKRSFFIDANPASPAFHGSDLDDALQVLRDYLSLLRQRNMPLIECLPPQFRQHCSYNSLFVTDHPRSGEWRHLPLIETGRSVMQAKEIVSDPLKRVKSVLFAPGLPSAMNFSRNDEYRFSGRFFRTRNAVVEASSGRALIPRDDVAFIPEMNTVVAVETIGATSTCNIYWPDSRTEKIHIAEGSLVIGVFYSNENGVLRILQLKPGRVIESVGVLRDAKAKPFTDDVVKTLEGVALYLWQRNPSVIFTRIVEKSIPKLLVPIPDTSFCVVMDLLDSCIFDNFKILMFDFAPQSLIQAHQKSPAATEKQKQLAMAFYSTDRSLAFETISRWHAESAMSAISIAQMYRDTFPLDTR